VQWIIFLPLNVVLPQLDLNIGHQAPYFHAAEMTVKLSNILENTELWSAKTDVNKHSLSNKEVTEKQFTIHDRK